MPTDRTFRLQLLESRKAKPSDRKRDRITRAKPETTPRAVLRSLKDTRGADDILKRVPDFGELALWQQIAYLVTGREARLVVDADDPLGRHVWFRFAAKSGAFLAQDDGVVFRAEDEGKQTIEVAAVNENLGVAREQVEFTI